MVSKMLRWPSTYPLILTTTLTPLLVLLAALFVPKFLDPVSSIIPASVFPTSRPSITLSSSSVPALLATNTSNPTSQLCSLLAASLPSNVFSNPSHDDFRKTTHSYWSEGACEEIPACVVRPKNAEEVSSAVKVLKKAYDHEEANGEERVVRFAVRSGGHSPEKGFATLKDGVVLDLGLLNVVDVAEDKSEVWIGVGARWVEVYDVLDVLGLGVVGGRVSDVGVGGLSLGGGISFFSPRYGMVCDNIDEYEVVLADGMIARVTATERPDLWKALKGGTGNFGILTRIRMKTFVSGKIWSGYNYYPQWEATKVLTAFYDFNKPENFDEFAGGPILAMGYVQQLGIRAVACSLTYTKPEKWAPVFNGFKSIWQSWSAIKIQTLPQVARYMLTQSPYGFRQFQVTTTIKNDLETMKSFHDIYGRRLAEAKAVTGSVWALAFQPLSPAATRKGNPNVLGLATRGANETLVIVMVTIAYPNGRDDAEVERISRGMLDECDEAARARGTADPFRYLNYAASGQDVLGGYGEENKRYLHDISRKYDSDGFFQRAKQGGFKLGLYAEADARL